MIGDSGNKVAVSRAHARKGFVTGITLAELMLIIIFILILALVIFQRQARLHEKTLSILGGTSDQIPLVNSLPKGGYPVTRIRDVWEDLVICANGGDNPICNGESDISLEGENRALKAKLIS